MLIFCVDDNDDDSLTSDQLINMIDKAVTHLSCKVFAKIIYYYLPLFFITLSTFYITLHFFCLIKNSVIYSIIRLRNYPDIKILDYLLIL